MSAPRRSDSAWLTSASARALRTRCSSRTIRRTLTAPTTASTSTAIADTATTARRRRTQRRTSSQVVYWCADTSLPRWNRLSSAPSSAAVA